MAISKVKVTATNALLVGNRVELHDASLPRGAHEIINVREVGEEFLIPAQLLHIAVEKGFSLTAAHTGFAATGGQYTPPTQAPLAPTQEQLAAAQQEQPRAYVGTLGENKSGETLKDDAVSPAAITNRTRRNVTTDANKLEANPDVHPLGSNADATDTGFPPASPNVKPAAPAATGTNNA